MSRWNDSRTEGRRKEDKEKPREKTSEEVEATGTYGHVRDTKADSHFGDESEATPANVSARARGWVSHTV